MQMHAADALKQTSWMQRLAPIRLGSDGIWIAVVRGGQVHCNVAHTGKACNEQPLHCVHAGGDEMGSPGAKHEPNSVNIGPGVAEDNPQALPSR